jgi:hypothetical protein
MDMGFVVICQLARRRMPLIRFLYIGSHVCSTLLSDLPSPERPCASLSLHLHQVVKRTFTFELSNMLGTQNEAARRWLGRHKQVQFHYTPTHASWVNLIECFFSILSKQGLAHSVQHSKRDLKDLLHRFLASYNQTCNPFTWTKGPQHLQRIIETTKEYQTLHPRKPRRRRAKRKKADSIRN